jgi:transcriptional regulator with XRE-family HTH domain
MRAKYTFGKRVAAKRERLGFTLAGLGKKAGVGKSTIGYVENAGEKSNVSLDKAEAIAESLGEPLWYMLMPDDKYQSGDDAPINEVCALFCRLEATSRDKVLSYLRDQVALQNSNMPKNHYF